MLPNMMISFLYIFELYNTALIPMLVALVGFSLLKSCAINFILAERL